MDTVKLHGGARPHSNTVHENHTGAKARNKKGSASCVKNCQKIERIKLNYARLLFSLFCLTFSILFFSCEIPESFRKTDTVKVKLPEWPLDEGYPPLLGWKISVTGLHSKSEKHLSPDKNEISLTVEKDYPSSILIYPVTVPDFFYPAGTVYPMDKEIYQATWPGGICAKALKTILELKDYDNYEGVKYFNWQKLYETLEAKDTSSFEKYDSLATKKCTTSYNTDFEILIERIINPPSRFTVPYFDTKSYERSKITGVKEITGEEGILLSEYIPLNELNKEKGCITVQVTPKDHKAAFLSGNKIIYLQKNKAYPLKE